MIHLSGNPRKLRVAVCGQPVDGSIHSQTMLIGAVDCEACQLIFRTRTPRGGYPARPTKS